MEWEERIDRFEFHDNETLHNDVHSVTAVEFHPLVFHRQIHLPPECYTAQRQLVAETLFISRLQESRAQLPVDFDGSSDNGLR